MIKALLFDMDGTLLDSMGMWRELEHDYMTELGIDISKVDFDMVATMKLDEVAELLRRQFGITATYEDIQAIVRKRIERYYRDEATLRPGVREMLEYFRSQGVSVAVGTATAYECAVLGLKTTGIYDLFDFVQSVTTAGFAKNDKRFYREAAERFGCEPEEIALFDDALYALATAKAAGLYAVGLKDPAYAQDIDAMVREADEMLDGFDAFDAPRWLAEKKAAR